MTKILDTLLDFIFPKRCVGCGKIGKYFCDQCTRAIRVIQKNEAICPVCERLAIDGKTHPGCRGLYTPDGLTSFFRYDGPIRKAIKTLKYRLVTDLASEFVSLIPSSFYNNKTIQQYNNWVMVPIPLHPSRHKERGFNQAEVLGRLIAEKLHIPLSTDILRRTKKTEPQVSLKHRKDRLINMNGVFAIHNSQFMIHDSTIFLFDDVFTTGATMRAATNVLKRAGVRRVWCVTMAR